MGEGDNLAVVESFEEVPHHVDEVSNEEEDEQLGMKYVPGSSRAAGCGAGRESMRRNRLSVPA